MKIQDYKQEYNKYAQQLSDKIKQVNAENIESSTNTSSDNLTELYNKIQSKLDTLNTEYSSTLYNKQLEIADTFIQALQEMVYFIELKKNYIEYKKTSDYVKSIIGENSTLNKLLTELDNLVVLYVNFNQYNCSSEEDKNNFIKLEEYMAAYNSKTYEYNQKYTELCGNIDKMNTYLCEYDENIYCLNALEYKYSTVGQIVMNTDISLVQEKINSIDNIIVTQNQNIEDLKVFTINDIEYKYETLKTNIGNNITSLNNISAEINTSKTNIKSIKITERDLLIAKIQNIIDQLTEYIAVLITENNILPDFDVADIADQDGHREISTKVDKGGARSFYVKTFKDNRFCGYMGSVDRKGYVGQKAQIFLYIPVDKEDNVMDQKFYLTSPLLQINNVKYTHNAANVINCKIFHLFDNYDYVGQYLIENDGSTSSEDDAGSLDEYIYTNTYFRFDSLISDLKEVNISKSKHSCRLKCDENSDWVYGSITKKGIFSLSDVSITGKFDGEIIATDLSSYDELTHFADTIDFSMNITSTTDGTIYTYSGTDLEYDDEYTSEQNAASTDKSSYFRGSIKLQNSSNEDSDEIASYYDISDFNASKDVIIRITKVDDTGYKIEMYLDPESSTNSSTYEDSGNDASVYLPLLAANITISYATINKTIQITGPKLESISALLDLVNFETNPFDTAIYSKILERFNTAKNAIISSLLQIISKMNTVVTTETMTTSIYSSNDSLYTDTYTSDITTAYSELQTSLSTYTSSLSNYDVEDLYNGVFLSKIESNINDLYNTLYEIIDDIAESHNILYKYNNKLCNVMKKSKNSISFSSSLSVFYNTLTGDSQTFSTLESSGQDIITFNINSNYTDWINIYDNIKDTSNYFIETSDLQYIYCISQVYNLISKNIDDATTDLFLVIDRFYRTILLRILKENISNNYYKTLYKEDVYNTILDFKNVEKYIECSYLDFNKYYINPYIVDQFPSAEKFNTVNINDLDLNEVKYMAKAIIYRCILETSPSQIYIKLYNVYKFINNMKKMNVRELIFMIGFNTVMDEISNDSDITDNRYKLNISYNYDDKIKYLKTIVDYSKLISSNNTNPINDLLNPISTDNILDKDDIAGDIYDNIKVNLSNDDDAITKSKTIAENIINTISGKSGIFEIKYTYNINNTEVTAVYDISTITLMQLLLGTSSAVQTLSIGGD